MGNLISQPGSAGKTSGRLEVGDFSLQEVGDINGKGLSILTAAIWASKTKVAEPENIGSVYKAYTGQTLEIKEFEQQKQNKVLAALVRDIWVTKGWIQAYESLVQAIPGVSLHSRLLEDVKIAVDIYSRIQVGEQKKKTTDLKVHIGSDLTYDNIHWVGPKSAGGNAWKSSKE